MNRPLRIELENGLYHITARGDRQDTIFRSDNDRLVWLSKVETSCQRFNFVVHAYCQMGNHYHILLETLSGKLARGMRHLNGNYSRYFNRTHHLVGHVFQGRYKAILCQSERYLQELARYIELNPVRARLVSSPVDWPWSSHRATLGLADAPAWLRSDVVLSQFGSDPDAARRAYQEFVADGNGAGSPLARVSHELLLGDETFKTTVSSAMPHADSLEIKRFQRRALASTLQEYFKHYPAPKEAMARAYLSLNYSMAEIAREAKVSAKTVSRAIAEFERKRASS